MYGPWTPSPFGQIYTKKIQISSIFAAVSLHFKSENGEFGVSVRTLDTIPVLNFITKIAQGDLSLGENFYQKFDMFAIFSYLSPYFYTDNVKNFTKENGQT